MSNLSERSKKILSAIVEDYILSAEPVSSKAIALRYAMGLSPATIRNIMAELEEAGFLVQPHTSAGRVPTDKGFRLYVDSLMDLEEPPTMDKELLLRNCDGRNLEEVLHETARALSTLTNCAGLMFVPRREHFIIKHVSLLPVEKNGITILMVSSLGLVQSRFVRLGEGMERLDIERTANYLNSIARGLTVGELRARVVQEMQNEKNLYDELLAKALRLGAMALKNEDRAEEDGVYVEGRVNIMEQPEFRDDVERMRKIFSAFEQKSLLVKLLDKSMDESGIHVYLGSEGLAKEFEGLGFVTAPYGKNGEICGTLGVVGPVRMNYSRIIPIVNYTAGLLTKVL